MRPAAVVDVAGMAQCVDAGGAIVVSWRGAARRKVSSTPSKA